VRQPAAGTFLGGARAALHAVRGPAASTFPDALLRHPRPAAGALLRNALWQCVAGLGGVLASLFVVTGALFAFVRRYEDFYRSREEKR
jgi:hypothetical protein